MELLGKIESILFVASKPLSIKQISKATGVKSSEIEEVLEILKMKYNKESGINILFEGDKIQMASNPDNLDVIEGFIKDETTGELTKPQLETLTVIAYRGPITRPELEQIRGVNCAIILRNLMLRGLIEEADSKDKLMPVYNISFEALGHLGISSVNQLPDYEELNKHEYIENVLDNN